MNRMETTQIITLLAGNYSSISDKTKEQKQMMINTWQECLGDLEYKLVLQAVKKTIIESPFPPTIHEIRKNAIELVSPNTQRTAIEAWEEAYKMIRNGIYMSQEEFEEHSHEVKKFFGSLRQVHELAKTDLDVVNTVTKGQFLKQYELIVGQVNKQKLLPPKMQDMIGQLSNKMSIKELEGGK